MPLLRQASSVAIVQITGEKDLSKAADPAEAVRNLKLHGIAAEVVAVELEERDAATTLQAYCERDGRELLVMGRSEEHTSELQSLMRNSYAVFCLKKKNKS